MASFEQNLEKLEKIVSKMEAGDLPLDVALAEFEQGVKLARSCQQTLDAAEQKVEILLKQNSDNPALDEVGVFNQSQPEVNNDFDDDDIPF